MITKIPTAKMSREEWRRLRQTGIGGSEAGAVCGADPYSGSVKEYRDKTEELKEENESESIRIGHNLEEYVAQRFTEVTGLKVSWSNVVTNRVDSTRLKKERPEIYKEFVIKKWYT